MNKEWYIDWFSNKYYLELYRHRDEKEATDLINLIQRNVDLKRGDKVLDVCCGSGRHSIEFAKRGFDVTGFDLSEFLIGEAKKNKEELQEKNLKLKFQKKDMRDFNFKRAFTLAVNIFSSFGYFESDEENFSVFGNVHMSLRREGLFVFDFLNESYLKKNLVKKDFVTIGNKRIIQERRLENNFVYKDITIGRRIFSERIKLYTHQEICDVLEKRGFGIRSTYGDYYGNGFVKNKSKRFIIFAQKN